jgi:hypothetical protein
MNENNLLLVVAVVAVAVSIIGAGITYNSVATMRTLYTGLVSAAGTINISIESAASINFTTDNINWGSGRVTPGLGNATLYTALRDSTNVTGGNWTGNIAGLIIENIGNVNTTLLIMTGKNSTDMFGATSTNPLYQYNVTNDKANSCVNATGFIPGTLYDVNTTGTTGTLVCAKFQPESNRDVVRIDIKIRIPSDSRTGAIGDTITATAESA